MNKIGIKRVENLYFTFLLNLSVILYGLAGVLGKLININPLGIVLGRTFFASIFLLLVLFIKRQIGIFWDRAILLYSFFGAILAFHWYFFFLSIKISSIAIALLAYSTFPIYIIIIKQFVFKKNYGKFTLLLVVPISFGIRLLIPSFKIVDVNLLGVGYGLVSGLLFAIITLGNEFLVKKDSPIRITFFENFSAFCLLLLISSVFEGFSFSIGMADLLLLLILGIFSTALAHTLFVYSMKRIDSIVAAIIASMEPVYGIIIGLLVIGGSLRLNYIVGGLFIMSSVTISNLMINKKNKY